MQSRQELLHLRLGPRLVEHLEHQEQVVVVPEYIAEGGDEDVVHL